MSLESVDQLYKDVALVSNKFGGHFAEAAVTTMFNANLQVAKQKYPDDPILAAVPEATGQVRNSDLLVRTGQLKAIIQEKENEGTYSGSGYYSGEGDDPPATLPYY